MECEPFWKASLLGSAFVFAQCITMLIVPRLGDKFGRKPFFVMARVLDSSLYAIVLFTDSYHVMLVAIVVLGLLHPSRLNVGLPYLSEWFPTTRQTLVQALRLIEQATITVFFTFHFWFMGNDTMTTLSIGYVISVVTTVMILPFPESPRLLLSQGRE